MFEELMRMSGSILTRRQFIAGAGAAALSLPFITFSAEARSDRPNIVFVLADDLRADHMSCAGHPFLHTPNLDRIAREGARFTNAFVTISLCSPSRACFLTGQYAHRHGLKNNASDLPDTILTFPQVLQKAGYHTAYIGKWHMGTQVGPRRGFDHWVSFKGQGVYNDPVLNVNGVRTPTTGYTTDILTHHAADWLRQPRTSPFCLYLSHKAVHSPFTPAVRHSKLFEDVELVPPASMKDDLTGKPKWQKKRIEAHPGILNETRIRNYARTLMAVDDSVGRVLTTLAETGQLDNTIVVFAGDNGFFLGEHQMLDKRAMYEESIRVPLLMRYPAMIRPGSLIHEPVLNIDLCPTFLHMAGEKSPASVQGRSVQPLLRGQGASWRNDFLYEYFAEPRIATPTMRGVRGARWKYVEYPEINDLPELYDLKNDPHEMRNLAADPGHAKVLSQMRKRLAELIEETA